MNLLADRKKILLFSTLNPYPFWAGSENLWFDFFMDPRVHRDLDLKAMLADSPVTREKGKQLNSVGITTGFYRHFNVDFTRRNMYRLRDKIRKKEIRTLPWYREIEKNKYDLVWFNVAALADLDELYYAVQICKKTATPYWLILQHGYEDFFCASQEELDRIASVANDARRFVFIADRNRQSLERAIGQQLPNAFRTVNSIPAAKIEQAHRLQQHDKELKDTSARFFNLGRFSPRDKAQHLILESLTDKVWKERDWQLEFIGVSGFGKSYLEKMIRYFGLNMDNIRITAHTSAVMEAIAANEVLLMPSLSEGTPFAMVESMACGKPALGTPVGGIPELIEEGKTGWLSDTVAVSSISEALERAWSDRERWTSMGQQAAAFVAEQYNQQSSFQKLLAKLQDDILS